MKRLVIGCLCILMVLCSLEAQELFCEVTVSAPDASKVRTDPKVFKTLENTIAEFMNNRKWTDENFEDHEKIQLSIFIGITDQAGDNGYTCLLYTSDAADE